jgi:hypothetical protein
MTSDETLEILLSKDSHKLLLSVSNFREFGYMLVTFGDLKVYKVTYESMGLYPLMPVEVTDYGQTLRIGSGDNGYEFSVNYIIDICEEL